VVVLRVEAGHDQSHGSYQAAELAEDEERLEDGALAVMPATLADEEDSQDYADRYSAGFWMASVLGGSQS
jgi:hypothetical protein